MNQRTAPLTSPQKSCTWHSNRLSKHWCDSLNMNCCLCCCYGPPCESEIKFELNWIYSTTKQRLIQKPQHQRHLRVWKKAMWKKAMWNNGECKLHGNILLLELWGKKTLRVIIQRSSLKIMIYYLKIMTLYPSRYFENVSHFNELQDLFHLTGRYVPP